MTHPPQQPLDELQALCAKLRRGPTWSDGSAIGAVVGEVNGATMSEAADTLERQAQEIQRLREALTLSVGIAESWIHD